MSLFDKISDGSANSLTTQLIPSSNPLPVTALHDTIHQCRSKFNESNSKAYVTLFEKKKLKCAKIV